MYERVILPTQKLPIGRFLVQVLIPVLPNWYSAGTIQFLVLTLHKGMQQVLLLYRYELVHLVQTYIVNHVLDSTARKDTIQYCTKPAAIVQQDMKHTETAELTELFRVFIGEELFCILSLKTF